MLKCNSKKDSGNRREVTINCLRAFDSENMISVDLNDKTGNEFKSSKLTLGCQNYQRKPVSKTQEEEKDLNCAKNQKKLLKGNAKQSPFPLMPYCFLNQILERASKKTGKQRKNGGLE